MDRIISIKEDILYGILNTHCTCGGRGPQYDPCNACAVLYEIIACHEVLEQEKENE